MDKELIIAGIIVFSAFAMGFFLYPLVIEREKVLVYKCLDGLWTKNSCNFEGDWVHINIGNMSFERCVEVARHECGHELFAEKCENNPELCFKLSEILENESNK